MKETLEEVACLYVLDQLDPAARSEVDARLPHEPELAALVHELQSVVANAVRGVAQTPPPPDQLMKIEAQIDAAGKSGTGQRLENGPTNVRWISFARWGIAALIAVSLSTLAIQSLRRPKLSPMIVFVGLDSNRNTFKELPLHASAADADARFVQLASMAEKFWRGPKQLPRETNPTAEGGSGYVLFDPSSRQGFIAVDQLPPIAETQRYHLWLLDPHSGTIRDAGSLPLSGGTGGLFSFTAQTAQTDSVARPQIFITIEDVRDPPAPAQPHGRVVLGDSRI